MRNPSRSVLLLNGALLASGAAVAALTASDANWNLKILGLLTAFAIASDLMAASIRSSNLKVSGSFLAIVVAMVLLGGAPAALIGIATIVTGSLKWRVKPHFLLANLAIYATFPLACGLPFTAVRHAAHLTSSDTAFAALVFGLFVTALLLNFLMVAAYRRHIEGHSILDTARQALVPLLVSDVIAAILAVGVSEVELHYGLAALTVFGALLLGFQQL